MEKTSRLVSKAGPRLIDLLIDSTELDIVVTAPGMLVDRLEVLSNLDCFDGCDAGFYKILAERLEGTVYCGHTPPQKAEFELESHRMGMELSISLGEMSMYQSLLRLRTKCGNSIKAVILDVLGKESADGVMVVLNVVRASGNHEHHGSAHKAIKDHEKKMTEMEGGHHHGH